MIIKYIIFRINIIYGRFSGNNDLSNNITMDITSSSNDSSVLRNTIIHKYSSDENKSVSTISMEDRYQYQSKEEVKSKATIQTHDSIQKSIKNDAETEIMEGTILSDNTLMNENIHLKQEIYAIKYGDDDLPDEFHNFKFDFLTAKRNNTHVLAESKECKRLLDLKYNDLVNMINRIQTSVIFTSTISGFMQATKTQFDFGETIISVVSITIATYISLVLSISKYYGLDELKERIQLLRKNTPFC